MGTGVEYADEISRALCVKFRGRNSYKEGRVVTPPILFLTLYLMHYDYVTMHGDYVIMCH